MSKKNKTQSIELPAIYQELTRPNKASASHKVLLLADRSIHGLKDSASPIPTGIPADTIDMEFKSLDDLMSRQPSVIDALHAEYLKCEPPKGQGSPLTACYLWAYWLKNCTPHMEGHRADGTKERKSTISTRLYSRGPADPKTTPLNTPQAKKCLEIFTELIGTSPSVTEEILKAKIYERAAELKTRQDPWRIFQYYRPQLIQAKLLKHD